MLLGDGCLKTKTHIQKNGTESKYYEYVIAHCAKQKDYLEYKRDLFHSIMGGKSPNIIYEKRTNSYRWSRCHKLFRLFHKTLYSNNNKKYFTDKVFRYLTPHSIAIWYMDDGGLSNRVSSAEMRLYTYFSEEEADKAMKYFNDIWGIKVKKRKYTNTDQFNLIFNTTEGRKFEELISKYIIPSMKYKLPSYNITRALDTQKSDDIV